MLGAQRVKRQKVDMYVEVYMELDNRGRRLDFFCWVGSKSGLSFFCDESYLVCDELASSMWRINENSAFTHSPTVSIKKLSERTDK